jgi:uncharacterized protein YegP (UPF0339 family)
MLELTTTEGEVPVRCDVYADTGSHYRWRLWSGSNKVAASGESFASKSNAERAAEGFKTKAKTASYSVTGSGSAWYWHAKAANGEKIATGGESFVSKSNAENAADNVRDNAGGATGP